MKLNCDKPASPVIVALGANLPAGSEPPEAVLRAALSEFSSYGLKIYLESSFFRTPCFPAGAGPDYVNAVVAVDCDNHPNPDQLLQILHSIEARHGRERLKRWAGRTLDLDLIAVGDSVLPDRPVWQHWHDLAPELQMQQAPDQLILPHPRLQDRAFVLVPLAEILPGWCHPVSGLSAAEMLAALPEADRAAVVAL